jgi:hypothetical protein
MYWSTWVNVWSVLHIISRNVSLLQKNIEAMLSIVHSNSKGSIIWFSIGKKIKKHVQIGVPIGSEKRNSQPPRHSSPLRPRCMVRQSALRKRRNLRARFFPLFCHAKSPLLLKVSSHPRTRHRRARVAGKAPTHQSPSCAPSLPPATRTSLGTSKPLPSLLGTGSRWGTELGGGREALGSGACGVGRRTSNHRWRSRRRLGYCSVASTMHGEHNPRPPRAHYRDDDSRGALQGWRQRCYGCRAEVSLASWPQWQSRNSPWRSGCQVLPGTSRPSLTLSSTA